MVQRYAVVLGLMGFATVLLRGALANAATEATLGKALVCLAIFAAIGAVVAGVGQWILSDTVRERLEAGSESESRNRKV